MSMVRYTKAEKFDVVQNEDELQAAQRLAAAKRDEKVEPEVDEDKAND